MEQKKAVVVSLHFNPGHVSHLIASYKLFEGQDYHVCLYLSRHFQGYVPDGYDTLYYGTNVLLDNYDVALFVFPSQRNLIAIRRLKRKKCKVIYVFHEPLAPMKEYRTAGFSTLYLVKLWIINQINAITVKLSDIILLPSNKAVGLYQSNALYKNKNFHYLPLLYDDERVSTQQNSSRQYISYIGTVAADHSFEEFLVFVEKALTKSSLSSFRFLIATKSDFIVPPELRDSSRVIIRKGQPMTNEEINRCYADSYVVWNAYSRTTQSGVLAKSFMFGTPAIILKQNLSEFVEDGKEVVAISDNKSFKEIEDAILKISSDFESFSLAARKRFEATFYYKNYNSFINGLVIK